MEPSLALHYSSDLPLTGGVAAGWQLALPEISRDPSRALDGTDNDWTSSYGRLFRYTEPGTTGTNTYRAWGDASFTRFTQLDASRWEARTTEGIIHTFARVPSSLDDRLVLVSSRDRFGNTVQYNWARVWLPTWYAQDQLQSIFYTENKPQGLVHHAQVTFVYAPAVTCSEVEAPIGAQLVATASGPIVMRDASPLSTIRTEVRDSPTGAFRTVREVSLTYRNLGCAGSAPLTPVRQLATIQENARATDGSWQVMPAVGFQYGDLSLLPTVERTGENFNAGNWPLQPEALSWGLSPRSGGWDWNEVHSTLIDLDGDGDQDRLVASRYDDNGFLKLNPHCTALLYRNLGGNQFSEFPYPVSLPRLWHGKYCTLSSQPMIPPRESVADQTVETTEDGAYVPVSVSRFLDIDRDGLVDLVSAIFLPHGDDGTNDQNARHPNCDPSVPNPPFVVCGGPGATVMPQVVPTGFLTARHSQHSNGRYIWRWYRNTGHSDFELTPRFIASPIPLDLVGTTQPPNFAERKEQFSLVDLTGDGALDAVWANPNAADWAIWKGDGQGGFQGNPNGTGLTWIAPITAGSTRSVVHDGAGTIAGIEARDYVKSSLIDVNSDGRPDLVAENPNSDGAVVAYINTGRGFGRTTNYLNDPKKATERLVGMIDVQSGTLYSRVQDRRITDLNGDGLLDRIDFTPAGGIPNGGGTLSVALGYGPSLKHSSSSTTLIGGDRGIGVAGVFRTIGINWYGFGEITDMDGDGYADVFGNHQLHGLPATANEAPPGLLTRIDSGRDASTVIRYASRSDSSVLRCSAAVTPFAPCGGIGKAPRRVVRDVTLWSEGRNGPAVTSYEYEDPVSAADEIGRIAFRGFARVRITAPSHGMSNGVERRAVTVSEHKFDSDYRGLLMARQVLDEKGQMQMLEEHTYLRVHVAASGNLPVYVPRLDRQWTCVPRPGILTDQATACRQDTGLETFHEWKAFAPFDLSGYQWPEGEPGPNLTLWRESGRVQVGIGAGAPSPTRRTALDFGLVSDATRYLSYPTITTKSETVGTLTTQLAQEVIEYEQLPLALPYKTKTWLRGSDFATSMRRFHSVLGVVLWEQKPEQYRRAPNASDSARIKTSYTYDPFFLYPVTAINEKGHTLGTTKDLGTGVVVATTGPNFWTPPSCGSGCQPVWERTRTDIDGFGRVTAAWVSKDHPTLGYELKQAATNIYTDSAGTWPRVESRRFQFLGDPSTAIRELVQFDATGLLISVTTFAGATNGSPLDAIRSVVNDAAGSTIAVTVPDPANDSQYVTYNSEFDALGREVQTDNPDGASIRTEYSGSSITRQEIAPVGDPEPGPLAAKVATLDCFGDLRTVTELDDLLSAVTTYRYDGLGRLRETTDPSGVLTALAHDGGGRRTSITRGDRVWTYGYDDNGNQTTVLAPRLPTQDPALFTTSIVYDDLDRPTSKSAGTRDLSWNEIYDFGDSSTTWTYDQGTNGIGRLRSVDRWPGLFGFAQHTYVYDSLGNTRAEGFSFGLWNGAFSGAREILREFDALGRVRKVTHADATGANPATQVAYEYDLRGLPSTSRWLTAPGAPLEIASLSWNRAGALTRRANSISEQTWSHYRNGRTQSVSVRSRPNASAPWTDIASQTLRYFAAGDVRDMDTVTAVPSQQASFIEHWDYDYDNRHQLTAVSGPSYEGVFAYTTAGRLQSVFVDGPPELDRDVNYDYTPASLGDPETVRSIQGPTHTVNYQWDRSGNQTSQVRAGQSYQWQYRYDGSDDLREARGTINSVAKRETYWYDHAGNRTLALTYGTNGQPTGLRLWFGETEIHYAANGAISETQAYVSHGGSVGRVVNRSAIEYTFSNPLNNLLAAVDSFGNGTAGFTYSPFGEVIRSLGSEAQDFRRRFNGKEHDASTGLHYYGARYYDDFALLWTQADPLFRALPDLATSEPRQALLYQFSLNNPLRYYDPDGLCVSCENPFRTPDGEWVIDQSRGVGSKIAVGVLLAAPIIAIAIVAAPEAAVGGTLGAVATPLAAATLPQATTTAAATGGALVSVADVAILSGGAVAVDQLALGGEYTDRLLSAVGIGQTTPSVSSSKKLGQALEAVGFQRQPGDAAHHIVAGTARAAAPARAVLARFGIDINSAYNGVFLPRFGTGTPMSAVAHGTLHTAEYYDTVNTMLQTARTREEVIAILGELRDALLSGGL